MLAPLKSRGYSEFISLFSSENTLFLIQYLPWSRARYVKQVCKHNMDFLYHFILCCLVYLIHNHYTLYIVQVTYYQACTNPECQVTMVRGLFYIFWWFCISAYYYVTFSNSHYVVLIPPCKVAASVLMNKFTWMLFSFLIYIFSGF
jgi:hypothetical protein